jgi:hypothetical protein
MEIKKTSEPYFIIHYLLILFFTSHKPLVTSKIVPKK